MSLDRIDYLLRRFFDGRCTSEEKEELAWWIDTLQNDEEWKSRLKNIWNSYVPDEKIDPEKADIILKAIVGKKEKTPRPAKTIRPFFARWQAAAAVILLVAASFVYFEERPSAPGGKPALAKAINDNKDITPGGNKAMLTLANGTKITLDSMRNGALAQVGNMKVVKVNSGLLALEAKGDDAPELSGKVTRKEQRKRRGEGVSYNTLTTPRGGQYRLVLPDGSKVWLNAASSLRFPAAFAGKERRVEVSGEAYFEIAKNARMPFVVDIISPEGTTEGKVQVLGTRFNINAYRDEAAIKTTLLEGAVKVVNVSYAAGARSGRILSRGEQAVMNSDGPVRIVRDVNLEEAVAWKNGLFDFEGTDIQSVMREIARWYNVDIKYEHVPSAHFMGSISRNVNISDVLKMLELTGVVHFGIEGRTITVLP